MAFLRSLSPEELHQYHRVIEQSVEVRSHFDMLLWLQGDMQRYLPHDIMVAAWGDFANGNINHDILSPLEGVRSKESGKAALTPLLQQLFARWNELGKKPFAICAGENDVFLDDFGLKCALGDALQTMRSALVHGILDERGNHDCLYVTLSKEENFPDSVRGVITMITPYLDAALRQVELLPHQEHEPEYSAALPIAPAELDHDLSDRELEILKWVAMGKTNPEIGSILNISSFTVKNHVQRVFKKLNVTNRAQAVSKLTQ